MLLDDKIIQQASTGLDAAAAQRLQNTATPLLISGILLAIVSGLSWLGLLIVFMDAHVYLRFHELLIFLMAAIGNGFLSFFSVVAIMQSTHLYKCSTASSDSELEAIFGRFRLLWLGVVGIVWSILGLFALTYFIS